MAAEYRLQLVPNWNGITMPDTTPMPKATEKILIQKEEIRNSTSPMRRCDTVGWRLSICRVFVFKLTHWTRNLSTPVHVRFTSDSGRQPSKRDPATLGLDHLSRE